MEAEAAEAERVRLENEAAEAAAKLKKEAEEAEEARLIAERELAE